MNYRLLADNHPIDNDTWKTGLNNNDIIIGPSGSGKTRGYVLPNILQCNGSMIITDTKGALREQVGDTLIRNGYTVLELNLTDCRASTIGYNPLRFIRYDRGHYNEQDILRVSACLVPQELRDPFWDNAARMLLEALVGYVLECQPENEHTLDSVVLLLSEMGSNLTVKLLDEFALIAPGSFPALRWKLFRSMAPAHITTACIQGILAEKLCTLTFGGVSDLFARQDQLDFAMLGRQKTALFLIISDTDRSLDRLAALLYTQALQELCSEADRSWNHRLNIPVRLYLDDFAASATIPDFDKIVSIIRSREISVSIIIQSLSQLESLYSHAQAMTVINNCDNMLYLGGQDVETARYISVKANKPVSSILNMPLADAWLFTRGQAPQQVRKYDLKSHPSYLSLPESQQAYSYDDGEVPF